jgi:hypothetical protein
MKFVALFLLLLAPALHAQSGPSTVTSLTDTELRHAIETAPGVQVGLPGLHIVVKMPILTLK